MECLNCHLRFKLVVTRFLSYDLHSVDNVIGKAKLTMNECSLAVMSSEMNHTEYISARKKNDFMFLYYNF